jgi:hypothetical protein
MHLEENGEQAQSLAYHDHDPRSPDAELSSALTCQQHLSLLAGSAQSLLSLQQQDHSHLADLSDLQRQCLSRWECVCVCVCRVCVCVYSLV